MPTLQPVDESFFTSAPTRFSRSWSIARPAPAVWQELVDDRALHWCTGLSVQWLSPRPFGVGTTRQASVFGALKVQEHFFIWEEGHRYAFYGTGINLPLFTSLAEDYVVEPTGPDSCSFTWTVAARPSALGKPGGPVNKLLFDRFFSDTGRHFAAS
ncbi:SRPBCC family protein [Pseudonocardia spinosispora]|uniref:SRPBCC family protein n=1 Tax=Pseudonocardia spinosispora TaxID=103441 RepID=UPI000400EE0A|nr:SRPBCC family protein [Pseudonocardia spinosispora]